MRSTDDHALRDDPKGACNIDGVRGCAVFPNAADLMKALNHMKTKLRTGRLKNAFHIDNDASLAFEYRATLVNAIMELVSECTLISLFILKMKNCTACTHIFVELLLYICVQ